MKSAFKVFGGILALLAALVAVIGYLAMGGQRPLPDRQELAPGVVQVRDGFVGVGVIRTESGKVILIDAGNDPEAKALHAELKAQHAKPEDVWAIFLTHGHPDHRKGVAAFPKASVYLLAADADLALGKVRARGPLPRWFPAEDDHVRITRSLKDGETVSFDGVPVAVFELPGHTPGSAAYLVKGVLFLGDGANFTKYGRLAGPKWIFSDDTAMAIASLRALAHRLAPMSDRIVAIVTSHSGGSTNGMGPLESFAAEK